MSLIEVLISIFVLSIGLLGVAAMIPVGRYEIVEAAKADRSAAGAKAAMREVKIRGMLEPYQYPVNDPAATSPVAMWSIVNPSSQYTLIDPRYLQENGLGGAHNRFPNQASGSTVFMPRVDLRAYAAPTAPWMSTSGAAERIFVWHDDLLFEIPDDKGLRPVRVLSSTTNEQHEGNYSWMVMVEYDAAFGSLQPQDRTRMTVSIPVFYKRNLLARNDTTNGERVAAVLQFSGGLGGGDVRMQLSVPDDAQRLKKHHWILVAAPGSGSGPIRNAAWYRVVAVAEPTNPNDLVRRVTLAGPDWDTNTYPTAFAVLMEGVVNVFTETVELNRDILRVP